MSTELLPRTLASSVVAHRNAAVSKMDEAIALLERGHALAEEAHEIAKGAYGMATFYERDRSKDEAFRRLFLPFNPEFSSRSFRGLVDARTWMNLVSLTGLEHLMDYTAKEQLRRDLSADEVPEVTEENLYATFENFAKDAKLIFQRGLAHCFSSLDRRFKSHDAFKIGSRIILTNVFNTEWGCVNIYSHQDEMLADVERVFAVLEGNKKPNPGALMQKIQEDREGGWGARQSLTETEFFRARVFKNGNVHLWFKRDDLVEKANKELADYYGEVLPDGVPSEEGDLTSKTGALSRDLAFYPTPTEVVRHVLQNVFFDENSKVLEPSAGTGNMVRVLLDRKAGNVDAIEVHPDRCREMRESISDSRLQVLEGNFLRMPARPEYTHVIMNPPFYGTHWMEHVVHAMEFLKPGGTLVAILPVTAELGETRKHVAFRKWAKLHTRYGQEVNFHDLPAESFKASGTRVNTVYLTLYKKSS